MNSNWSYGLETAKFSFDVCDLDLWPPTLTFCMDIIFVTGNIFWKFHDDTMTGTLRKKCDRQTDGQTDRLKCSYNCLVAANNRAPLLSYIKLCASFHRHMWIQTGVAVRKLLNWFLTFVTLTFDLWPRSFAWISLLSLVISPENFMIRGWEHGEKGVTDRWTDGQTDGLKEVFLELLGRS